MTEPRELQHFFEDRWGRLSVTQLARFLADHNIEDICRYRQEWIREAVHSHSDLDAIHNALIQMHSMEVQRLEQAAAIHRAALARSSQPKLSKAEREARDKARAERKRRQQVKEQMLRDRKLADMVRRERAAAEAAALMSKRFDVSGQLIDPQLGSLHTESSAVAAATCPGCGMAYRGDGKCRCS